MQPRTRMDRPVPRTSRDLVLTALRARGPMSRAELARQAGIAPSTISAVVQELAAAGLVVAAPQPGEEAQPGEAPRPGRPGLRLTLNPRLGAVAGVEFCFDKVRVLLCDLAHSVGAEECHRSLAGLHEPSNHAQQSTLARAIVADHDVQPPRREAVRNVAKRGKASEELDEVL